MDSDVERVAEPDGHRVTVYGHDRVLAALRRALFLGRGSQSYLLVGPPGIGKRTVGLWLAQALLCEGAEPGDRPCGACRPCRLVERGQCADVHVAETPLRVDEVRATTRVLSLAPSEARCRVALVPDVDAASIAAANALLKTLEEPPLQSTLIVTASDIGAVLPTIRSRCRQVALRPIPHAEVARALVKGWDVPGHEADLLARLSTGRLGWAVAMLEDGDALADRRAWLDRLVAVLNAREGERMGLAEDMAKADDLQEGLRLWRGWWRDLMLLESGADEGVVNRDRIEELRAFGARIGPSGAIAAVRAIDAATARLEAHVNAPLALDVLVLDLPS